MKTLPNGLKVFNATPHVIRFWREGWNKPIEVESDGVISACPREYIAAPDFAKAKPDGLAGITFVETVFEATDEGLDTLNGISQEIDVVVGSIIAAQAYPGSVVAMTPAPGYGRAPPAEKRMNPDKFTVF